MKEKNEEVLLRGRTLMPPSTIVCTKCGLTTITYVDAEITRCECGATEGFEKHTTKKTVYKDGAGNPVPVGADGKPDILEVAEEGHPKKDRLELPKKSTKRKKNVKSKR